VLCGASIISLVPVLVLFVVETRISTVAIVAIKCKALFLLKNSRESFIISSMVFLLYWSVIFQMSYALLPLKVAIKNVGRGFVKVFRVEIQDVCLLFVSLGCYGDCLLLY
jgi:hypothetical protein